MRLLFVSNLYPPAAIGGYERVCQDVAKGLETRGHDVVVLTSGFRASTAGYAESKVFRLLKLRHNFGLTDDEATPWIGANRLVVEWHNARTVRGLVGRLRPDAVMVWQGDNLGRTFLAAAAESAPVVCYVHDSWLAGMLRPPRESLPTRMARHLYNTGLQTIGLSTHGSRADVVFISRALQSQYAELGIPAQGTAVIHNGIDSGSFSRQRQHILERRSDEPHRILFSGRVAPEKGVTTLVRALGKVRATAGLEQTRLNVLGVIQDRAYEETVQRLVQELGLASAIDFLPPRPRSAMPAAYAAHDVLAFPSEWQEPFALTLLEAMATGLPVVSTTTGGSAEVLRDGENASTFQVGDADDLAGKLVWMLMHPEQAAALGSAASEQIHSWFTLEAQVIAIESLLEARIRNSPRSMARRAS